MFSQHGGSWFVSEVGNGISVSDFLIFGLDEVIMTGSSTGDVGFSWLLDLLDQ